MDFKATVLHQPGEGISIESVQFKGLGATEVLVQVKASGLCRTNLEIIDGKICWPFLLFWNTRAPRKLLR